MAWLKDISGLLFGMLVGLLMLPIFTYKGENMSAETVADYIRNELADGKDDNFRWDDFEHTKIRDPYLEGIRKQAIAVKWPLSRADQQKLQGLLKQLSPQSN